MRLPLRLLVMMIVIGLSFSVGMRASAQPPLEVGAAIVDITPEVGEPHYRGKSTGTHDPLHARATAFRQGETEAIIVVCDLLNVKYELTQPTREQAARQTKLPIENIILAATHTHAGPSHHNDFKADNRDNYSAKLSDKIVHVIEEARLRYRPVQLSAGVAQLNDVSFNRRFVMKDGSVRMNPGLRNPNIVRPDGPIDPELGMIVARDAKTNEPIAALTNFALHLDTVGGTEYSADFPYYIHRAMSKQFGEDFVSVFGTGCCGNINHLDVSKPGPQRGHREGHQTTLTIGRKMAKTARMNLPELRPVKQPSLAIRRAIVPARLQSYTDKELAWAKSDSDEPFIEERPFLQRFRRYKIKDLERLHDKWGEKLPLEVHAIRLSDDCAIVTLPGEVFVELGLAIKKQSPFKTTLVIELANKNPAYIPDKHGFKVGDYEAVNSRVVPGSGEQLVDAVVGLLKGLKE